MTNIVFQPKGGSGKTFVAYIIYSALKKQNISLIANDLDYINTTFTKILNNFGEKNIVQDKKIITNRIRKTDFRKYESIIVDVGVVLSYFFLQKLNHTLFCNEHIYLKKELIYHFVVNDYFWKECVENILWAKKFIFKENAECYPKVRFWILGSDKSIKDDIPDEFLQKISYKEIKIYGKDYQNLLMAYRNFIRLWELNKNSSLSLFKRHELHSSFLKILKQL